MALKDQPAPVANSGELLVQVAAAGVLRRDRLGGPIHEHSQVA